MLGKHKSGSTRSCNRSHIDVTAEFSDIGTCAGAERGYVRADTPGGCGQDRDGPLGVEGKLLLGQLPTGR